MELADKVGDVLVTEYGVTSAKIEWLQKFADLVAAREREACAKVVEQAGIDGYGTLAAAAMVRARGEK
jgi:hypothetical protein